MNIYSYLNGTLVDNAFNEKELALSLNFDEDNPGVTVSITDWRFVTDNATIINNWIASGLNGGVGVFEGIPYKIDIEKDGNTQTLFDGYLDLKNAIRLHCEDVTIPAKEKLKIDWLNDTMDGFSFQYLAEEAGIITADDYLYQPYVVSSVPDYKEAAMAYLMAFIVFDTLLTTVDRLAEFYAQLGNIFEATTILRLVIYLAYLVVLLAALIKVIKDFIQLIIQPVKYHAVMREKTLFEKACQHLGITFKSSIYEGDLADMVYMPRKFPNPLSKDDNRILGYLNPDPIEQTGYYDGVTAGQFFREMKLKYNGKYILQDDVLTFERRDYNQSQGAYVLPDIEPEFYTLNTNECNSNFVLSFATDPIEKNTIQQWDGTSYQVYVKPKVVLNQSLVLMTGLKQVNNPHALAKRKEELTLPETIISVLLDDFSDFTNIIIKGVNLIIKDFNTVSGKINNLIDKLDNLGINISVDIPTIKPLGSIDLDAKIKNRIGMMLLETDMVGVPKTYIMEVGSESSKNKVSSTNKALVSASNMYASFYCIESFVPTSERPNANQYYIYEHENIPFSFEDYLKVKNNNFIFDAQGNRGEIIACDYNPWEEKLEKIKYKINRLYTNNLTEVAYAPPGK